MMQDEVVVQRKYYLSKFPTRNGVQRPGKHRVRHNWNIHILSPWRPNRNRPIRQLLSKLPPLVVQSTVDDPLGSLLLVVATLTAKETTHE